MLGSAIVCGSAALLVRHPRRRREDGEPGPDPGTLLLTASMTVLVVLGGVVLAFG